MRTNIVVDDRMMEDASKVTGLQTLVRLSRQADIKKLRGKLTWEGILRESRSLGR